MHKLVVVVVVEPTWAVLLVESVAHPLHTTLDFATTNRNHALFADAKRHRRIVDAAYLLQPQLLTLAE